MNLQAKTLFFFTVSLFLIFSACKSKKNLGQDFVPDNEKIGVYADSIPLEFATLRVDSTNTRYTDPYLIGQLDYNGVVRNEAITYSRLYYVPTTFDPVATCDSMFINISKVGYIFGDTIQDFTLKVFPTTEVVDTNKKFGFQSVSLEANPIAQATFVPRDHRVDSVIKMRVDMNYANAIFQAAKSSNSDSSFGKIIKSLAYVGSSSQGNTLIGINRSAISIVLYYSKDKVVYYLNLSPYLGNTSVVPNIPPSANFTAFNSEFRNKLTNLSNKDTLKSTDNDGKVYLQANSSLKVKTKIPPLEATIGTKADNIIINRAEIFIKSPKILNMYNNNYYDPSVLYIRYSNKDRGDVLINKNASEMNYYMHTQAFGVINPVVSYYDVSRESYRINVTEYIQKLIDNKLSVRDLIIDTGGPQVITLGDGTQDPKNFILKIQYSKLK